jgi:hypothetical protein
MSIYVTISNDDDRESAVIGVTKKWRRADGTEFTEQKVELKGGESRRFVVQPDDGLQLHVCEVDEPVPCWC